MIVHQFPARQDNYIFLLQDPHLDHCVVIDPTEATPIRHYCQQHHKKVSQILITHHHDDHIHAVLELQTLYQCPVLGARKDQHRLPPLTKSLSEGDSVMYGTHHLRVVEAPGHTLGHIMYFCEKQKILFCGDVLFRFGCGRIFEGTPEMMHSSLQKILSLPCDTKIYCSHEYTRSNLLFCMELEPHHQEIAHLAKELFNKHQDATVPFFLGEQKRLSPFLRGEDSQLKTTLGLPVEATPLDVFREVRARRDR